MDKFNELIASPIPTLIEFYAPWCGPCRMMHPILDELNDLVGDTAHIVKVDVDALGNKPLMSRFEISYVPTFIIFKNGEVVWQQSGMAHAQTLKGILEKV